MLPQNLAMTQGLAVIFFGLTGKIINGPKNSGYVVFCGHIGCQGMFYFMQSGLSICKTFSQPSNALVELFFRR